MKKTFINPARANKADVKAEARVGTGRALANITDVKVEARSFPTPLLPVANITDVKVAAAGPGGVKQVGVGAAGCKLPASTRVRWPRKEDGAAPRFLCWRGQPNGLWRARRR